MFKFTLILAFTGFSTVITLLNIDREDKRNPNSLNNGNENFTSYTHIPRNNNFIWIQNDNGKYYPAFLNSFNPKYIDINEIVDDIAVKDSDIEFFLYNKKVSKKKIILNNIKSINESGIDYKATIKIICHGWNTNYMQNIKYAKAFNKRKENYNIILINWEKLAYLQFYPLAVENVKIVGEKTARFIEFLCANGASLEQFHVEGHSLGAHVAGYAGSLLSIGKLPRITGLDPALPLFDIRGPEDRLDPSDAEFVVVSHTAMGILGFVEPIGHVDFYPNGGLNQPHCLLDLTQTCSHVISIDYDVESIIRPKAFKACKCKDFNDYIKGCKKNCSEVAFMGVETDKSARGNYYLQTNTFKPYGQG